MPKLDRDGVAIHYDVQGDGPVVVLTHGYSASTAMWRDNVPALVAAGYRVLTWDMRGHGQSASPDAQNLYSAELTVGDMDALLDVVGADKAVIGGMSLGGYMSLAYHLGHPERVRALMLIDTGPGFKSDAARETWNARARSRADDLEVRGEAALSKSREAHLQAQDFNGLARAARGMLAQENANAITSLPGIKVPRLVVVGDRDEPFLAASDYMTTKIPGARKVTISDAGHASNVDQPDQFNAAVIAFLKAI
ncbi:MAG: alpha/beta fold hydrolase [Hyphomicrobiaceae bacterium]